MSSNSSSHNSSIRTASEEDLKDLPPDNGLYLQLAPFRLEHLEDYESGGHHPVHLGDSPGVNGRYVVLHKLGHGGFANVWLCRDTRSQSTGYVALKILMAEISTKDCSELHHMKLGESRDAEEATSQSSEYICLPLDKFDIDGPNGTHYCFVYPVLGPKVSLGLYRGAEDSDEVLRNMCLKVVQAIASLHGQGICHGGTFTAAFMDKTSIRPLVVHRVANSIYVRFDTFKHPPSYFGARWLSWKRGSRDIGQTQLE